MMNQVKNTSNKWAALAILCAAQFMMIMDTSMGIGTLIAAVAIKQPQ